MEAACWSGSSTPAAYLFHNVTNMMLDMRVMFDDTFVHALPTYVGEAMSAMAGVIGQGVGRNVTISAVAFPIGRPPSFDWIAYVAIYMIGNSLAFVPGSFAIDVVKDRQLKVRIFGWFLGLVLCKIRSKSGHNQAIFQGKMAKFRPFWSLSCHFQSIFNLFSVYFHAIFMPILLILLTILFRLSISFK